MFYVCIMFRWKQQGLSKLTNSSILACLDVNVKRRLLGKRNDIPDVCVGGRLWLEVDRFVAK